MTVAEVPGQPGDGVRVLFWFTEDLRLADNPALAFAARGASELSLCYCHDSAWRLPDQFGTRRLGRHREAFLRQSLDDLSRQLAEAGHSLWIEEGSPVELIEQLVHRFGVQRVVRSRRFGYHEREQWRLLEQRFPAVEMIEIDASTLFDASQVDDISPFPATFSKFRRIVERIESVAAIGGPGLPRPVAAPQAGDAAPAPGQSPAFTGGESAARDHLESYFDSTAASEYKLTRNALDDWVSSTKFSPWLAAGCLSPRQIVAALRAYEQRQGANESTYWIYFELLWREYFQWYAGHYGSKLFSPGGINDTMPKTVFDAQKFTDWCRGETPWPLVNACMRQLNCSGYLSNRGRQVAASALVNELGIDWRAGAGYFEHQLIDYDVGSNWGNWQYIAGVGADPRGGRHFSLAKQAQQYDPDGSFVRRWCGESAHTGVSAA